jgi:3-oxoacyl-[acyl-carrier protein] reductase
MKATFDASGEVLLVTGGASGIGAALAAGYAAAGGTVVVFDLARSAALDEIPRIDQRIVDVSDRDAVFEGVGDALASHGRIDALVAGAAVQPREQVLETTAHAWRGTIAVNLDGVVWACQATLPELIRRGNGSILVFGSGLGASGHARAAAYAASKAALVAYAKSLAAEVAPQGIRVNVVFPGVIDTPQFRVANPSGGEREHWERTVGIGAPADVLGPLLFLLSDAATMTGSVLTRDRAWAAS